MEFESKVKIDADFIKSPNIMDKLDKVDIQRISNMVWEGFERDLRSRSEWEQRMDAGLDLAMQVQKDKNFPWQGCSNVIFPLITIAALQFSARSYSNIIQGTEVVRYRVVGEDPSGEHAKRADRIGRHMSWQVLEEDAGWEEEHDKLLINLGIVGTNFIKTYYSPSLGHNVSKLVHAKDFVLDYYARSVEECARKTQVILLYRNEIYERCKKGIFDEDILTASWFVQRPVKPLTDAAKDNRTGTTPTQADDDTPFETLEQHRLLDLDGDGYAEPYIVTIEKQSKAVLRIVTRFEEKDIERNSSGDILCIKPTEYYTKYSFIPSPDGGIYDIGFGVLLGPLNEAVNSGINQLLDSGTMQNSMGGFLGRGAKIRGGVYTMAPWEWKRVDSTGDDLRKNLVPFPERQPSVVMFQLLNLLINYTDRISGATDPMVGVNPGQNTPAETSRNMIEQGMQVYNSVFKRVWRSMKEEFKKLHKLNGMFLKSSQNFGPNNMTIRREDYTGSPEQIAPVADPNLVSPGARLQKAMLVRQASVERPGYDQEAVERNFLKAAQVDNIDDLYKGPEKLPPPKDPKIELENKKLQVKAMGDQAKVKLGLATLAEQRRLNNANIAKLEAQVIEIMETLGIQRGDQKLQAIDMAISAMHEQDKLLNERMKIMAGGSEDGDVGGGISGMAAGPEDGGVPEVPEGMGGESEEPVG